jgi:hypothetical protein
VSSIFNIYFNPRKATKANSTLASVFEEKTERQATKRQRQYYELVLLENISQFRNSKSKILL